LSDLANSQQPREALSRLKPVLRLADDLRRPNVWG
jgi:hypothetical protein